MFYLEKKIKGGKGLAIDPRKSPVKKQANASNKIRKQKQYKGQASKKVKQVAGQGNSGRTIKVVG